MWAYDINLPIIKNIIFKNPALNEVDRAEGPFAKSTSMIARGFHDSEWNGARPVSVQYSHSGLGRYVPLTLNTQAIQSDGKWSSPTSIWVAGKPMDRLKDGEDDELGEGCYTSDKDCHDFAYNIYLMGPTVIDPPDHLYPTHLSNEFEYMIYRKGKWEPSRLTKTHQAKMKKRFEELIQNELESGRRIYNPLTGSGESSCASRTMVRMLYTYLPYLTIPVNTAIKSISLEQPFYKYLKELQDTYDRKRTLAEHTGKAGRHLIPSIPDSTNPDSINPSSTILEGAINDPPPTFAVPSPPPLNEDPTAGGRRRSRRRPTKKHRKSRKPRKI